ncbi:YciI family protein [Metabacillus sp. RGM 3146]|uniref:YciI family protein n=1 Tax=Metabacillus sp. RGM 3146 TaxID=3401092 RepID=UPI003B9CF69A
MKQFLIFLSNKNSIGITNDLVSSHKAYLRKLKKHGHLKMCGPFEDNDKAFFIYSSESIGDAASLLLNDPIMQENCFSSYEIHEFSEANISTGQL